MRLARRWLGDLLDVRPGERGTVALMMVYGFLALTSYYVIKPVRNSIFLARVGADHLPLIYVLTAVVVIAVMVVYSRHVERVGRTTLLLSSFAALGAALVVFWWLLRGGSDFATSGAFYVFGKIYPLFLVSQFWLVANLLFTTAQARRLFGPVGVGLVLGAVAGSGISGGLADTVGTANLLLVSAGILVLCAGIVVALAPRMARADAATGRLTEEVSGTALQLLARSPHLRTIAWILGLTIVAGTLLDWQFNRAVEMRIVGEDAKTEFFGLFYGGLNVVSVGVQLLLTGLVLRRWGLRVALLVLPLGLLVTSVGIVVVPGLVAATVAKGTEGSLRYSLDQATRELLFLPVPERVKYKVKPLIDLAIYRGGTGIGGVLLLVLVNGLGLSLRGVAVATVAVCAAWVVAAVRMRREFAASLRRLIGVRDVKLEELIVRRLDAGTLREIGRVLERGRDEEVEYALALLEIDPPERLTGEIAGLLDHGSATVRARAVRLLQRLEADQWVEPVRRLLHDPSLEVRAEAIQYLCRLDAEDAARRMDEFLADEDPEVRTAATGCLLRHGGDPGRARGLALVQELARSDAPTDRRRAAKLLAEIEDPPPEALDLMRKLITDDAVAVCHDAMEAAGRLRAPELAPVLLERLCRVEYRMPAAAALRAYGPEIHPALLDRIEARDTPPDVRSILPGLLVPDAEPGTIRRMAGALAGLGPVPRYEMLKALNKLRREGRAVELDPASERALVEEETATAFGMVVRSHALRGEGNGRDGLLLATLGQRHREAVERSLRTLALRLPAEDLYAAFAALRASDDVTRQRGHELLDSTLPQRYRGPLSILVDPDARQERRLEEAEERFDLRPAGRTATLDELRAGEDPWLALLAAREAGEDPPDVVTRLEDRMRAEGLLVRRSALPRTTEEIMDIIERAEALRQSRVLRDLRTEDLVGIAALAREHEWRAGDTLFAEDAPGNALHLVTDGRVEARKGERVLFVAEAGETVGSLSMLDGLPTDYAAVACTDSRTLSLDREDFREVMAERRDVVNGVIRYLTGVVRGLNRRPEEEAEPAPQ